MVGENESAKQASRKPTPTICKARIGTREFSDQAAELKQAAEGSVADVRTSLQQERERATRLEQDVAAARRDLEKQTALAAKAGEEARQMKQAADSRAELQKSVEQKQERTARLEQDVDAARRVSRSRRHARPRLAARQARQSGGQRAVQPGGSNQIRFGI